MKDFFQKYLQVIPPESAWDRMILSLLIFVIAWILLRFGKRWIARFFKKTETIQNSARGRTLRSLILSTFRIAVFFLALTLILGLYGINTASLLTAAGIGGIALALGAQNVIADIIAGLLILVSNSLNVGDYVDLQNGVQGTVVKMELRQTVIRGYTGMDYIVPNAQIKVVANYQRNPMNSDVRIDIPNAVELSEAKKMIERVAERARREAPDRFLVFPAFIGVEQINAFTYTVSITSRSELAYFWENQRRIREYCIDELQQMNTYKK
ncbi:MAG: mechanosensitive ion channel family protein [Peptoniphilaceae bacterium]|nr:mechanosensitive ion channel family protein [Peptoniphilaceae bacterium]MDY4196145.1 mechanosensitive ion channel family protein [Peptoniphilaceae bacterium]MDY5842618.1 mechanosensitive ion channel family protein [Peptoniphilaceae bacterium]MDY6146746.1 mechanosensitive ion channel family protein [Peptoniphilaceae bacterium]